MRQVPLGRTGLTVSEVAFGGIPIQRLTEQDAVTVITRCLDLGITFLDTAHGYGTSEERIGKAATPRPTRTLRPTRTAVPTRTPVPTATPVPTPTVNFSLTTAALWSRHKSATELQWPVYVEDISGMRVAWQGSGEVTCSS